MKALIIGAGNIAIQYNFFDKNIDTHYKAMKALNFEIDIFELDTEKIQFLKTNILDIKIVEEINWKKYDFVSICSSTNSHFKYLKLCIEHKIPIILCEKPICENLNELIELKNIIENNSSKIYINYVRRYLKHFSIAKNYINNDEIIFGEIKYQRGFLNNASHAFDLLQFFLGNIQINNIKNVVIGNEEIKNDKNLSFNCNIDNIEFDIKALNNVNYNYFELILYGKNSLIKILHAGNEIEIYEIEKNKSVYKSNLNIKEKFSSTLENYMLEVYQQIITTQKSNAMESILLNLQLIEIKNKYAKLSN